MTKTTSNNTAIRNLSSHAILLKILWNCQLQPLHHFLFPLPHLQRQTFINSSTPPQPPVNRFYSQLRTVGLDFFPAFFPSFLLSFSLLPFIFFHFFLFMNINIWPWSNPSSSEEMVRYIYIYILVALTKETVERFFLEKKGGFHDEIWCDGAFVTRLSNQANDGKSTIHAFSCWNSLSICSQFYVMPKCQSMHIRF